MTSWVVGPGLVAGLVLIAGCPARERAERRAAPARVTAPPPLASSAPGASRKSAFAERVAERAQMVRDIEEEGVKDERVLAAMRSVPRHAFVLPATRDLAYADRPLPIVGGQTISQPYIVALMTEAVRPSKDGACLEIGTGSGYQAAVLAELCQRTYSIEYLPEVARFGEDNLRALGYGPDRVHLRTGDGYVGWPEAAPFDAIIVTAAPPKVPRPLLDQLAVGGRLVIPVGPPWEVQRLELWTRTPGGYSTKQLAAVAFVPFLGDAQAP